MSNKIIKYFIEFKAEGENQFQRFQRSSSHGFKDKQIALDAAFKIANRLENITSTRVVKQETTVMKVFK